MKKLVVPAYGMLASRSSAALLCSTGSEQRLSTLLKMTASRRLQLPDAHSGSSRPCTRRTVRHDQGRWRVGLRRRSDSQRSCTPPPSSPCHEAATHHNTTHDSTPPRWGCAHTHTHTRTHTHTHRATKRAQPHLVERARLVRSLAQALEQRKVQAPVLGDVAPDARQQHEREEALREARVEVGHKHLGGGIPGGARARGRARW
jgi:hypothetical protein